MEQGVILTLVALNVLILGCGFTGRRVACGMLARGARVHATTTDPARLADLRAEGVCVHTFDFRNAEQRDHLSRIVFPGCLVLHSVPSLESAADFAILDCLGDAPARVVYLSTTGVYGSANLVDESTHVERNERTLPRLRTEQAVMRGRWSSLVLRPAAIYGPGRGVQAAMRGGSFRLSENGGGVTSRIHADYLAAHVEAALLSDVAGAFPVADEHPCSSREVAEFCSDLLGIPMPDAAKGDEIPRSRQRSRRVDGRAIRERLGVQLRYRSYREGIPASL
ncbi:MAG: hypothetical protein ACRD4P_09215 [Bryobacteraceae bacterium]